MIIYLIIGSTIKKIELFILLFSSFLIFRIIICLFDEFVTYLIQFEKKRIEKLKIYFSSKIDPFFLLISFIRKILRY